MVVSIAASELPRPERLKSAAELMTLPRVTLVEGSTSNYQRTLS